MRKARLRSVATLLSVSVYVELVETIRKAASRLPFPSYLLFEFLFSARRGNNNS